MKSATRTTLPAVCLAAGALFLSAVAAQAGERSPTSGDETGVVQANGITLAYESFGPADRETILLIAGANAQLTMWPVELCEELVQRGYRVIRFDNRDVGLSTHLDQLGRPDVEALLAAHAAGEPLPLPYTITEMANDAVGLLDALGIEQAHIVGASMGGQIAQRLAIHHPARTRSLTSIFSDTGNPDMPGPAYEVLALPPPPPAGSAIERIIARELLVRQTFSSPAYPTEETALREQVRRDVERSYDPIAFERQAVAILAEGDRRQFLGQLTVPAVVLHGDADPIVPVENGRDTAATIPGAELRIIEGMAHGLPLQLVAVIADAITAAATRAADPGAR